MSNPKPKPRRPVFRAKNLLKIVKGKSPILLPKLIKRARREMGCGKGTVYNLLNKLRSQNRVKIVKIMKIYVVLKNGK